MECIYQNVPVFLHCGCIVFRRERCFLFSDVFSIFYCRRHGDDDTACAVELRMRSLLIG